MAVEGSMLYFLCIALSQLSHMYQYSLESFKNFFFKAIDETKEQGPQERILALRLKIRFVIFQWVSRGLLAAHKLIFLTLITFRLMQKKVIKEVEFE